MNERKRMIRRCHYENKLKLYYNYYLCKHVSDKLFRKAMKNRKTLYVHMIRNQDRLIVNPLGVKIWKMPF